MFHMWNGAFTGVSAPVVAGNEKKRLRYEADDIKKMSSNGKIQGQSAG